MLVSNTPSDLLSSRRPTTAVGTLALLVLLAAPAAVRGQQTPVQGQQAADAFLEVIDIELVDVDVWVSDPRGEPIHGLDRGDFTVFHDGKPVGITHFNEIRDGAPASDATPGSGPATAREPVPSHVIVYFDQTRLRPSNYKPLIASLRTLLRREEIAPERILLLTQSRGLSVEQPFGSTREEIDAALTRLQGSPRSVFDAEADTRLALDAIRDTWDQTRDTLGSAERGIAAIPNTTAAPGEPGTGGGSPREVVGGFGSSSGPDACGPFLSQIQPILDAWTRSRGQSVAVTLTNLADTASFLAGIPGVKLLLYLSDGLEIHPGTDLAGYAGSLCPAGSNDLLTSLRSERMTDRFLELTRHANANRVTIHALQTSGLRGSDVADASTGRRAGGGGSARARRAFDTGRRSVEREGLSVLAEETGGRAIFDRNDLGPEMAKIASDAGSYYSLAYRPRRNSSPGREHRIEVRIDQGKATSRYRKGYVEKDAAQWLGERVEGALNLGITNNSLGVKLAAGAARETADGGFFLPLHVIVPAERLAFLPRGETHAAALSIKVMARGVSDSSLTVWDRVFQVKGTPGTSGWADLVIDLELPAGLYVTAVGVRDDSTHEASFLSTSLEAGPGG